MINATHSETIGDTKDRYLHYLLPRSTLKNGYINKCFIIVYGFIKFVNETKQNLSNKKEIIEDNITLQGLQKMYYRTI